MRIKVNLPLLLLTVMTVVICSTFAISNAYAAESLNGNSLEETVGKKDKPTVIDDRLILNELNRTIGCLYDGYTNFHLRQQWTQWLIRTGTGNCPNLAFYMWDSNPECEVFFLATYKLGGTWYWSDDDQYSVKTGGWYDAYKNISQGQDVAIKFFDNGLCDRDHRIYLLH